MSERINRQVHLRSISDPAADANYRCECCGLVQPSFAFTAATSAGPWVCGSCLVDQVRAEAPASPPDVWDGECGNSARAIRNRLVASLDWTQLPDVKATMTEDDTAAWAKVRAQLRDVPETFDAPSEAVTWLLAWEAQAAFSEAKLTLG